ncbi:glucosyltransferase, partial [Coemansia erecta]
METTTLAVFAVFAAASFAVLQRVNGEVREPYMDEIFHVPQAQRYCKGAFGEWDPKLTTPPGLYVASLVLRAWGACTLQRLRLVNWALGLGLFWTIFGLIRRLHSARPAHAAACALTFSLLPTAFFFNHLYYTDTASLLCVLLAYLLSVRAQHAAASMVGFASLWMRQTNVVWVALIGATAVERWLRARGIVQADSVSQLVVQLCRWAQNPRGWRECTRMLAPYALVVLVFVAFVVANGGIVLGDKAHHQAGIHVPQMLYFYAFMCAMAAPTVLGEARNH